MKITHRSSPTPTKVCRVPGGQWTKSQARSSRSSSSTSSRHTPARTKFLSLEPLLGPLGKIDLRGIDWTIAGGESGPAARAVKPAWVRSIRDQCMKQNVAFHFKQWGGTNKKKSGRALDGRTWDEFPR